MDGALTKGKVHQLLARPRRVRVLALTGVPGSGKTTLADALAARGVAVLHLNEFARARGLLREKDAKRGAFLVDMDDLARELRKAVRTLDDPLLIVEGHFAHEMDVDGIVLLRCDPLVLLERLRARGWPEEKVRENVEAEALDVLAAEVLGTRLPATEIDVSRMAVEKAADRVLEIAENPRKGFKRGTVGSAAWPLELLPWS